MSIPKHLNERVLGYAIHTNRELGFMLQGSKPLAVFSDAYGQFPDAVLRYLRMFDRYVARGAFVRRDYVELRGKQLPIHVILYVTPKEEWRIEAMLELRRQMGTGAWTAEHERVEGELLGYTNWQNDIWINRRFSKPAYAPIILPLIALAFGALNAHATDYKVDIREADVAAPAGTAIVCADDAKPCGDQIKLMIAGQPKTTAS